MLNKLIKTKNEIITDIETINNNQAQCNKCKNGVISFKKIHVMGKDLKLPNFCECTTLKGVELVDYKFRLQRVEKSIELINNEIPQKFKNGCYMAQIRKEIKDFITSDTKNFIWLHGITGNGKTYSLFAILINQILHNIDYKNWLRIINEADLNYKSDLRGFIAIDDIGLSEYQNRNINLIDQYYNLIDNAVLNNKKVIFTSNYNVSEWLNNMSQLNEMTARRITSRFHNNIIVLNLGEKDLRK